MDYHGIALVCPACRGPLAEELEALRCRECGREFPVVLGIPDLRVEPDPYIGMEEDREKGLRLWRETEGLGFREAVAHYYAITPAVTAAQARQFSAALLAAEASAERSLAAWESHLERGVRRRTLLDLGCGTGPVLASGASRWERAVGVDVAFRWLVMARIRLAEAGAEAPLVCACAEALPFPEGSFDGVVAGELLEHCADPDRTLEECHRTLRPGAPLLLAAANRWSLGPDPHAGVPMGGYLPDRWIRAWVSSRGGVRPRRHRFSETALRAHLRVAGFEDVRTFVLPLPAEKADPFGAIVRAAVALYNVCLRIPGLGWLPRRLGPKLHAVAWRSGS